MAVEDTQMIFKRAASNSSPRISEASNRNRLLHSIFTLALAISLAGCGGGSAESAAPATPVPPAPTPPAPEVVVGVATPDSVAVVTATNAG